MSSPEGVTGVNNPKTDLSLFSNLYLNKRISQSSWLDYILLQTQNNLRICRVSVEQGPIQKKTASSVKKEPTADCSG